MILRSVVALFVALVLVGCSTRPAQQTYTVDAQGAVSAGARSALDGSTAPGRQEILGIFLPFPGTGLAIKAGLEWDGTPTVIQVPVASAPQTVTTQKTVMVPETRTVMVPRTVTERSVVLPVPQAAPATCDECCPK